MCNVFSYGSFSLIFFNKFWEPSATGLCDFTWNDPHRTFRYVIVNIFLWFVFFSLGVQPQPDRVLARRMLHGMPWNEERWRDTSLPVIPSLQFVTLPFSIVTCLFVYFSARWLQHQFLAVSQILWNIPNSAFSLEIIRNTWREATEQDATQGTQRGALKPHVSIKSKEQ